MQRNAAVLLVLLCATIQTVLLVAGHGPWAGRPIWGLAEDRGLNSGDLLPLGLWIVTVLACLRLWRREG